jgi:uncharacterized protein (DUF58 family)
MSRLLLLIALAYLLLVVGLATVTGELLALSIPLIVYLAAAILYAPTQLQLEASRTMSADRLAHGTPVAVRLSVINHGSRLERVLIRDVIPRPQKLVEGRSAVLTTLPPGGTVALRYIVKARRGSYDLGAFQVTASDHLGLFRRHTVLEAPAHLFVLPDVVRLGRLAIRPLRTRGYAGPVPARVGGSGVDFYGVREYQTGDPRRWINWRVSARHLHSLFSNEFEQERIADVGLILDARSRSDIQVSEDSLFEHAVQATASLAERFLADGNRVGLLIYGRLLDWTFPGYGKVQRERILRALARAETGESQIFDSLDYLPTRYFPAQSQIVLVSPLCADDLPMLIRLRARGYQVLAIRPDPVSFEARALEAKPSVEMAVRIARVERALLLRRLQQVGIQVVDWSVDEPFDRAIHASLGRVPQWFRAVGVEL